MQIVQVVVHRNKRPACAAEVGSGLESVTWQDVEERANLDLLPQLLFLPRQPNTSRRWKVSLNRTSRDVFSSHPVVLVWTECPHQPFRVVSTVTRPPALRCSCSQ